MVSLWGAGKDGTNGLSTNGNNERARDGQSSQEPDERTRLLPNRRRPTTEGFLNPDDPAVRKLLWY